MNCANCEGLVLRCHEVDCYHMAVDRLAKIEDVLGEEYDLEELRRLKLERDAIEAELRQYISAWWDDVVRLGGVFCI